MNFRQRLLRFAIGVAIGSAIAYGFFGNRDWQCSYFPNQRVLVELSKKSWSFSETADQQWEAMAGRDSLAITHVFSSGDVDFDRSQMTTRHEVESAIYIITATWQDQAMEVEVENHADSIYFIRLQ